MEPRRGYSAFTISFSSPNGFQNQHSVIPSASHPAAGSSKFDVLAPRGNKRKWTELSLGLGDSSSSDSSKQSMGTGCTVSSGKGSEDGSCMDYDINFRLSLGSEGTSKLHKQACDSKRSLEKPGLDLKLSLAPSLSVVTDASHGRSTAQQDIFLQPHIMASVPTVDEGSTSLRRPSGGMVLSFLNQPGILASSKQAFPASSNQVQDPAPTETAHQLPNSPAACTSGLVHPQQRSNGTKICSYPGCVKGARGSSGRCIAHGGGNRCQKKGCNKGAEGKTIFCKAHGGGRRCEFLGCTKSAEGRTDRCIAHGGGRRCSFEGCKRAARGKSGRPLRLLLPLPQTLASAPVLHLSRLLFSSPASVGRAATLRALAYRCHPGRPRRGSSTLRKEMDGGGEKGVTFNRKRAEGTDGGKRGSMELKTRRLNPVNTTCYVQILGTGMDTQDTSPSILLFFDKQRLIFNAGEGLQRFCTEHKIKLSKIDHIFLTRVCSETAGGLPGLVLTLAGIGDEGMSVNIWGPSDLNFLAGAMRSFIPNRAMLHTHSFGVQGNVSSSQSKDAVVILDDEVVRISAMFVKPRYQNGAGSLEGIDLKPGDTAIVYACELPEIKGKFDPAKAAALGLKPGPKYRELQLGNSVQSDKFDKMVHPSDVLGPSIPGPIVLLVDCPTQNHMQELFSLQALSSFYESSCDQTESGKKVNCIIHLGPASVTKSFDYQSWMENFGATEHIMAGHEIRNMEIPILKGSARISSRLNFVCPQFFPSSGFWPVKTVTDLMQQCTSLEKGESVSAQNLLKFHLRPYAQLGLDSGSIPSLFTYEDIVEELISEIPEVREVPEQVRKFWYNYVDDKNALPAVGSMLMVEEPWISQSSEKLDDSVHLQETVQREHPKNNLEIPSCVEHSTRDDMEITFLGTGSSQPSKYRNVSSIYINLFARGGILLDCGEGTLGQLKRRFGVNVADEVVKNLRCIWISHIHADHHTGLARVLALRSKLLKGTPHKPLLVIGPTPLERFLKAYSTLEEFDMQFLDCRHTLKPSVEAFLNENATESAMPKIENTLFAPGSRMENYNRKPASLRDTTALGDFKEVLQESGLEILYSVPVVHCPQAFGVVLRAMEKESSAEKAIPGWKVVYSGDTRPCPALMDASRDATVLIHEATFEDSMSDEAIARNHSTTKEAIEVGTSAGAYRIILTHFSQRYPKIPVIDEVDMEKTCIAFDLMSVNLTDLPVLPKVLLHLKVLFKDELVVDEADEIKEAVMY